MTTFGDARRATSAHADLPRFMESATEIGLVIFDEDGREQPVLNGQVIRIDPSVVLFRHQGIDEEIFLGSICKRVLGSEVVSY